MHWILQIWESLTFNRVVFSLIAIVISVIVSYGAVILVMVKIPADYFSDSYSLNHDDRHFLFRWSVKVLKNFVGVALVIIGVVMLVGPGPGVVTILLGLVMIDIPGKRPLEISLIKRPAVLTAINNLRARYRKPPLILD